MGLDRRSCSCSTISHAVGVLSLSHGYTLWIYTIYLNSWGQVHLNREFLTKYILKLKAAAGFLLFSVCCCRCRWSYSQWESVSLHSQHLGVLAPLPTLLVSRCCISNCCKSARRARSSLICSLICDISCCICLMAVQSCRSVGVISSFSRPEISYCCVVVVVVVGEKKTG